MQYVMTTCFGRYDVSQGHDLFRIEKNDSVRLRTLLDDITIIHADM